VSSKAKRRTYRGDPSSYPCCKGDLRRCDGILRYSNKQIEESDELRNLVVLTSIHNEVKLNIWRNQKIKEVIVPIEDYLD